MYLVACQGHLCMEKKVKVCSLRSTITPLIDSDRLKKKNSYSLFARKEEKKKEHEKVTERAAEGRISFHTNSSDINRIYFINIFV